MTVQEVLQRHRIESIAGHLATYISAQRWFGGKERTIAGVEVVDAAELSADPVCLFLVVQTHYTDGSEDFYSVPVGIRPFDHPMAEVNPQYRIASIGPDGEALIVYDAFADNDCSFALWAIMSEGREIPSVTATLRGEVETGGLADLEGGPATIRLITGEQSNTAVARGHADFLKWVRRIDPGPSIEREMIDALRTGGFSEMAKPLGGIDYIRGDDAPTRLAFLQQFLPNATEGWALGLTSLRDLYAEAEILGSQSSAERRNVVRARGGSFAGESQRLGEVTADMHRALASSRLGGDVAPEPIDAVTLGGWADQMIAEMDRLLESTNPVLEPLRQRRAEVIRHYDAIRGITSGGLSTRIHGDFHLGQVMRTDEGWVILDFEGEPARPVGERRLRSSPLRDVAGMLRSFDYAAAAALLERTTMDDPRWSELFAFGQTWAEINRAAYWDAYLERMDGCGALPTGDDARTLRAAFEIQKAVYEVTYELGHRPDWVDIPLDFLLRVTA